MNRTGRQRIPYSYPVFQKERLLFLDSLWNRSTDDIRKNHPETVSRIAVIEAVLARQDRRKGPEDEYAGPRIVDRCKWMTDLFQFMLAH